MAEKRNRKSVTGVAEVCKESKLLKKEGRKVRVLFNVVQNKVFCVDPADTIMVDNINIMDCGVIDRYISMDSIRFLVAHKTTEKIKNNG